MSLVGLKDVVYCKMTDEENEIYDTSEGAVKSLAGAIEASISPSVNTTDLYADDKLYDTDTSFGKVEISLTLADLSNAVLADLLGHGEDGDGGIVKKSSDRAPFVAFGFKARQSDGQYQYKWLTKVKFAIPEETHTTKGENIEFYTPSISGTALARRRDDVWEYKLITATDNTAAAEAFFSKPYEIPAGA